MKIIFDSEDQMEQFMKLMSEDYCPNVLYLEDHCNGASRIQCDECWRNCGIEMEVEDE